MSNQYIQLKGGEKRVVRYGKNGGKYYLKGGNKHYLKGGSGNSNSNSSPPTIPNNSQTFRCKYSIDKKAFVTKNIIIAIKGGEHFLGIDDVNKMGGTHFFKLTNIKVTIPKKGKVVDGRNVQRTNLYQLQIMNRHNENECRLKITLLLTNSSKRLLYNLKKLAKRNNNVSFLNSNKSLLNSIITWGKNNDNDSRIELKKVVTTINKNTTNKAIEKLFNNKYGKTRDEFRSHLQQEKWHLLLENTKRQINKNTSNTTITNLTKNMDDPNSCARILKSYRENLRNPITEVTPGCNCRPGHMPMTACPKCGSYWSI